MRAEPFQVLQAAPRPAGSIAAQARLLIAGATGVLGNEVLRRLVGPQQFAITQVLAREPITAGLRGVATTRWHRTSPAEWPPRGRRHRRDPVRSAAPVLRSRAGALDPQAGAAAGSSRAGCARSGVQHAGRGAAACPGPPARSPQARTCQPGRAGRGRAGLRAPADRAVGAKAGAARRAGALARTRALDAVASSSTWCPAASSRCAPPRWPNSLARRAAAGAAGHPCRRARTGLAGARRAICAAVRPLAAG